MYGFRDRDVTFGKDFHNWITNLGMEEVLTLPSVLTDK